MIRRTEPPEESRLATLVSYYSSGQWAVPNAKGPPPPPPRQIPPKWHVDEIFLLILTDFYSKNLKSIMF